MANTEKWSMIDQRKERNTEKWSMIDQRKERSTEKKNTGGKTA